MIIFIKRIYWYILFKFVSEDRLYEIFEALEDKKESNPLAKALNSEKVNRMIKKPRP